MYNMYFLQTRYLAALQSSQYQLLTSSRNLFIDVLLKNVANITLVNNKWRPIVTQWVETLYANTLGSWSSYRGLVWISMPVFTSVHHTHRHTCIHYICRAVARDHGTLGYFRSLLNHNIITTIAKKAVDANLDFLGTVINEHILANTCKVLGIT